jgi:O-antigen/teichoic acid export membrane protein
VIQQRVGVSIGAKDFNKIGRYIGSSILISLTILLILSIALIVLYHYIFDWLNINDYNYEAKLKDTLIYAGIGTLMTLQSFGFAGINYGLQLFKSSGLVSVCSNVIGILFTFLLLPVYGVKALGLAMLIRGLIDLIGHITIFWLYLKKVNLKLYFSLKETKSLFGDVSFNFFAKFGSILTDNSQSFFITKYIMPEAAVIFRFTKTIPEISKLFISRPAAAIMPIFSNYLGQKPAIEDVRFKVIKMINYTIWICGLVMIGFVLLNKYFIDLWIGYKFYAGNMTNFIIVLWVVFSSITNNLSYTVFALGDFRRNNMVIFFQSILFVVLMVLFIKPLEILGIALALLVSQSLISSIYYPWKLNQYLKFSRSEMMTIAKEIVIASITIVLLYIATYKINFSPKSWHEFIGYTIACSIFYFICLYFISQNFKMEIANIFSIVRNRLFKRKL